MPLLPTYTESLHNGPAFDMILAEGGAFDMGADENDQEAYDMEKPLHKVQLDAFYIGKYPVTQALWTAVMGNNPSRFQSEPTTDGISGQRPVEQVSWHNAQAFTRKLNELTGKNYRLPTEAEWEYAARGGHKNTGRRYLYAGSDKLKEVGWYGDISHGETKPVGQKDPNELGLFDMSGNVYELCQDWYGDQYYKECNNKDMVENPNGPRSGQSIIIRGGSWFYSLKDCRNSSRDNLDQRMMSLYVGFRLVLSSGSVI